MVAKNVSWGATLGLKAGSAEVRVLCVPLRFFAAGGVKNRRGGRNRPTSALPASPAPGARTSTFRTGWFATSPRFDTRHALAPDGGQNQQGFGTDEKAQGQNCTVRA